MKRTVDGKNYDTTTAVEQARWNRMSAKGFVDLEETLFRTQKGAYFLYIGELEPGNHVHWIEPLTREESFSWAQKRGRQKLIDEEFADLVEPA